MQYSKGFIKYIIFIVFMIGHTSNTGATEENSKFSSARDLPLGVSDTKNSDPQKGWFDGYTLMPGIMLKKSEFSYRGEYDMRQSDYYSTDGTLIEENYLAPGLRFRSPISYNYPGHRWINADTFIEIAFSTFKASKQLFHTRSGYETEDMGTRISGKYLDIAYFAYIQLLDTIFIKDRIHALRVGLGAGARYFTAKGNITLTDPYFDRRRTVEIDAAETKFLLKSIIEYQYDNILLTFGGSGTGFPLVYDMYSYGERSYEIAYIFKF